MFSPAALVVRPQSRNAWFLPPPYGGMSLGPAMQRSLRPEVPSEVRSFDCRGVKPHTARKTSCRSWPFELYLGGRIPEHAAKDLGRGLRSSLVRFGTCL